MEQVQLQHTGSPTFHVSCMHYHDEMWTNPGTKIKYNLSMSSTHPFHNGTWPIRGEGVFKSTTDTSNFYASNKTVTFLAALILTWKPFYSHIFTKRYFPKVGRSHTLSSSFDSRIVLWFCGSTTAPLRPVLLICRWKIFSSMEPAVKSLQHLTDSYVQIMLATLFKG